MPMCVIGEAVTEVIKHIIIVFALLGITSVHSQSAPLECKQAGDGRDHRYLYSGFKSVTSSGQRCATWASHVGVYPLDQNHRFDPIVDQNFPEGSLQRASSYCRNPDNDPKGAWCWTGNRQAYEYGYCDLPACGRGNSGECPTGCPFNYEPVCGSDGVTYGNGCALEAASCEAGGTIRLAHQGECTTSGTSGGQNANVCDRGSCNRGYQAHYHELCCRPVYRDGACCPTSYNCEVPQLPPPGKQFCLVGSSIYNVGDEVKTADPCTVGCRCVPGFDGRSPDLQCVTNECPELFGNNPLKPGCSRTYEAGRCCSTGQICKNAAQPVGSCKYGGKNYLQGQKMYLDDECKVCICGPDFAGPGSPACEDITCGIPLHYNNEVNRGCALVYTSQGKCCPIPEFICPDEVALHDSLTIPGPRVAEQCRFGDHLVNLGEKLNIVHRDPSVTCTCQTPPQVTCIKQSTSFPPQTPPPTIDLRQTFQQRADY